MPRPAPALALLLLTALTACGPEGVDRVTLCGRAVLPPDTFSPGPAVGASIPPVTNGREAPFASVPVQGFSSLIVLDAADGTVLALQDNGFGTRANSADCPLRWYRLRLHLDFPPRHGGRVEVLAMTPLRAAGGRELKGDEYDPESFVRLDDGSFWVGEEFGPFLLHFGADGTLLGEPLPVPVPAGLQPFARHQEILRTPDHPDLRSLDDTAAESAANLPRSGGLEGLARNPDGSRLYLAVEKALLDDPDPLRRLILEFDPVHGLFSGRSWLHRVDQAGVSIAALECVDEHVLILTERDGKEGREAAIKRIYRVDLHLAGPDGVLPKTLVADLLDIADPDGFTAAEEGAVGLGPRYAFPYVTPEGLAVLDARTLLVACDNNYPFSAGRRPGVPDDNEFIRLRLPAALDREQ